MRGLRKRLPEPSSGLAGVRSEPALLKGAYEEGGLGAELAGQIPQPLDRTAGGQMLNPTELLIEWVGRWTQHVAGKLCDLMGDGVVVAPYQVVHQGQDALGGPAKAIIMTIMEGVEQNQRPAQRAPVFQGVRQQRHQAGLFWPLLQGVTGVFDER